MVLSPPEPLSPVSVTPLLQPKKAVQLKMAITMCLVLPTTRSILISDATTVRPVVSLEKRETTGSVSPTGQRLVSLVDPGDVSTRNGERYSALAAVQRAGARLLTIFYNRGATA